MEKEDAQEKQINIDEELQAYTIVLAKHAMRISESLHRAMFFFVKKDISDRSILAISILLYTLDQVMKMMQDLNMCTSHVSDKEIKIISDKIKEIIH